MDVQAGTDQKTNQTNAVSNLLDGITGGPKGRRGNPLPAVTVDNQRESQIRRCDDGHAEVNSLVVVARLAHLGDDGQESTGTGSGAEDRCDGRDTRDEGWITDDMVAELEAAGLRSRSRAISLSDTDTGFVSLDKL